jgi:hypothetical protein
MSEASAAPTLADRLDALLNARYEEGWAVGSGKYYSGLTTEVQRLRAEFDAALRAAEEAHQYTSRCSPMLPKHGGRPEMSAGKGEGLVMVRAALLTCDLPEQVLSHLIADTRAIEAENERLRKWLEHIRGQTGDEGDAGAFAREMAARALALTAARKEAGNATE